MLKGIPRRRGEVRDPRPAHSGRATILLGGLLALLLLGCAPAAAVPTAAAGEEVGRTAPSVEGSPAAPASSTGETPAAEATPSAGFQLEGAIAQAPRKHPFARRLDVPEFPADLEWLNTAGPLRLRDLKGKFVLFDFWTYCCINCIHVLPELRKLEEAYPNELVVIGVHSAKFEAEKDSKNIAAAILRYDIEHPVINDAEHRIWNTFGVSSWPTLLLIDPEGKAVWGKPGETKFEVLDALLKEALPYYRANGLLDETPLRFDLLAHRREAGALKFPGKVLAEEETNRLYITDSSHHRIVVTDLAGKLLEVIGSGARGMADGAYAECSFNKPQGLAVRGNTLWVADTENHAIREVDLAARRVKTIAGTGRQGASGFPGLERLGPRDTPPRRWVGRPRATGLGSPWALWPRGDELFIAMAGPHQIWKLKLNGSEIGPYAGNGREDIVDGPLLPAIPYSLGFSSFAQPSGLAADADWLYVADSEGSSIRAVPFDPKLEVKTVVGTSDLPSGRLFAFGDVDGVGTAVRLQHCLGVVHHEGLLYIADTYNNKIKVIDLKTRACRSLVGTGEAGLSDSPARFDEPAGISYAAGKLYVADTNNHAIRVIDLENGAAVSTLEIEGLDPPEKPAAALPDFADAAPETLPAATLRAVDGKLRLAVELELPAGWKINPLAPLGYVVQLEGEAGPIDRAAVGKWVQVDPPAAKFEIALPAAAAGRETVSVSVRYYYCQEGAEGLCKVGSVVFRGPLTLAAEGGSEPLPLRHVVKE